jgi:voltage-gated potassium channel
MGLKEKMRIIVFGTDTPAGKLFDIVLLYAIVLSVLTVIIDSIPDIHANYAKTFFILEWTFTSIFTIEYFVRIYITKHPLRYILSPWGIVDFLAILPSFISLFFAGTHVLMILRLARMMRVFRILKLSRFLKESEQLYLALKHSFYKISIFMLFMMILVIVLGTIMYVVEGEKNGFSSIPQSIYWAIITITTVGYGDIVPLTVVGKLIASVTMLMGYSILAVPTGIITFEISRAGSQQSSSTFCDSCKHENPVNSKFCNHCGEKLGE